MHPLFCLTANTLILYRETHGRPKKTLLSQENEKNLTRGKYNGFMSDSTRKSLKQKLTVYFEACYLVGSKFRKENKIHHTIITLTLPSKQMDSDNVIKRECLGRFLDLLKAKWDVRFYYWVAEKQENQNIHFHILCDRFVEWEWVRKCWNQRLEKLGYLDVFEAKHGHRNPNSTDIETIKSLSKSALYVTKYTSKVNQQGGIEGRLHGESDKLREVCKYKSASFHELELKIQDWLDSGEVRMLPFDFAVGFFGDIRALLKRDCPKHWKDYKAHAYEVLGLFYCNP